MVISIDWARIEREQTELDEVGFRLLKQGPLEIECDCPGEWKDLVSVKCGSYGDAKHAIHIVPLNSETTVRANLSKNYEGPWSMVGDETKEPIIYKTGNPEFPVVFIYKKSTTY